MFPTVPVNVFLGCRQTDKSEKDAMFPHFSLCCAVAFVVLVQLHSEARGLRHYDHSTHVLDIGHEWLPLLHIERGVDTILALLPSLVCLLLYRRRYGQRFIDDVVTMYVCRALVSLGTILPSCANESPPSLHFGAGLVTGRHDKWWSGHMSLAHLVARHAQLSPSSFCAFLTCTALCLLLPRMHYTADVVLGILGAELIFCRAY